MTSGDDMSFRNLSLIAAVWLSAAVPVHAQTAAATTRAPDRELNVGVKEAPPFAMKAANGAWSGLSIDLWRQVAGEMHLKYKLVEVPTVPDLIRETAVGSYDVGVGAITVTAERERLLDFSQSFYATGLGIAVPILGSVNWVTVHRALTSSNFLQAMLFLTGLTLAAGLLVWLAERKQNENFGGTVTRGLSSSVWWSTLAMTQRSSAERGPTTILGRSVATIWMVASVITIAVFTASVTSALTSSQIQGTIRSVTDLTSVRVGTVKGTAAVAALARRQIEFQRYESVQEGLNALRSSKIDAFVFDKPLLAWSLRQKYSYSIRLLDIVFEPQEYAFVLPSDSALRKPLSVAILDAIQSDEWTEMKIRYLGPAAANSP
jgi:ABC-type amino acid transport substrate-binding protein